MTSDIDIYRTAKQLVDQYGEDAGVEAAMRADQLLDNGDMDGYRVWKRIVAAVNAIDGSKPKGTAH